MKIAVNTRFLLKNRLEGMGRFTYETLRRIVLAHPEHKFYFFFDRPYDEEFIFADNVHPVVLFPPTRHVFLIWYWFEFAVYQALKNVQADVFLSTDNFLSLRTRVPTVLVTHDLAYAHFPQYNPYLVRKFYALFGEKFNRRANRIVAVSEYTKNDLVRTFGIAESKISVACNGCSPAFRPLSDREKKDTKQRFSDGKDYFFYVGAVHPRKNIPQLIKAFDLFKRSHAAEVKLLIGGRFAWQTGAVTDAYERARHKADIEFIGFADDADLPFLTGACLGFVYPSKFEGFGIPVLEAMHAEVPIITSDVSSLPEVAGDAALLVNPDKPVFLKEAMEKLFFDEKLRRNLVEKGKIQRRKFTWEKAAAVVWENILSLTP